MRIAWLDTLRVLASFLVILSHYAYSVESAPRLQEFFQLYVFNIGTVGVILFFAVSGYLAANSLERTPSAKEFYRRKLIRILVPYVTAYLAFGAALVLLGEQIQLSDIWFRIVPVDVNLIRFFELPDCPIVGEWFIGTILYLYALAPLLYKALKKNLLLTTTFTVAAAVLADNLTLGLYNAGKIVSPDTIFMVRVPEFLAGMVIFAHRNFIAQNIRWLSATAGFAALMLAAYNFLTSANLSIWAKIFIGARWNSICIAILTIFLVAAAANLLNRIFPAAMTFFNGFSKISYLAMLIHHTIIFQLERAFPTRGFWAVIIFALVLLVTALASEIIRKVYKPIEDKLIRG